MKKILFVDDETNILQGLQRILRPMRHEWNMDFVSNGSEALERLEKETFDVIVSDIRMPGMNGVELLTTVKQNYPEVVRIILSGQADSETLLRSVGPAHQYLAKPCDAETLRSTVQRVCELKDLLNSPALRQLASRIKSLPSLPSVYNAVLEALECPDISIQRIGEMIAKDVGMTAKILQLINSAFFGKSRRITDPAQAINLLGLETVRALILSVHVFEHAEAGTAMPNFYGMLWRHSITVATFAKQIAQIEQQPRLLIEDAFSAGLLHDAGKLVLASNLSKEYRTVLIRAATGNLSLSTVEFETFKATHAEVGAYLIGLWGLPGTIIEALAFHHAPTPSASTQFSVLSAVHVANALAHEIAQCKVIGLTSTLDETYLESLGLLERVPIWRDACSHVYKDGNYMVSS